MALQFIDADVDRVDLGATGSARNVAAATIMAWCRPSDLASGRHIVFGCSNGAATGQSRVKIGYDGSGGNIEGSGRALDGDSFQAFAEATGSLVVGVWSHIAARLDYVARTIELFHNGVSVGISGTLTGWTSGNTSDTDSLESSLGSQHGASSEGFGGDINDCRLYGKALTNAEISTIYAARGRDGISGALQHRFMMREAAPGVLATGAGFVKNEGLLQNNGTPINTPIYTVGTLTTRRKVS